MLPVRTVDGITPKVRIGGRLQRATGRRLGLKPVPAFADGFVSISHQDFHSYYGNINNELKLFAVLKSDRPLKDCYVVVVFARQGDAGGMMLASEVPDLDAGIPTSFKTVLAISQQMTDWRYRLHFYSGERELVTTLNASVGAMKDADVLAAIPASSPKAIFTLVPGHPDDVPDGLAGSCTIRCTIGVDGSVSDPAIVKTNSPDFAADAMSDLEQWILLPAIRDHQFVSSTIYIPFRFQAKGG
jgi:hypothetical protein